MANVAVGTTAPDFTLKDQHNSPVELASYRGQKRVLLVFYPFAFSGLCTGELGQVRDELATYQNEDVQVLAVSTDPVFALKGWSQAQGYEFPLLSDFWPHGEVARSYGVFNEKAGMANRGTFLIDRDGVVRFGEMNQPGEPRDQSAWKRALDAVLA
ncbi:MAG: peroxiredoxin [Mycobacteriales bacterium]